MRSLYNMNLYGIVDTAYLSPSDLCSVAHECCEAGIEIIQFRDKILTDKQRLTYCTELKKICSDYDVPFIVNDRLDIAIAVQADGVHLGQDDFSIIEARKIIDKLGLDMIIGASSHSIEQAEDTAKLPLDYLATGPLYPTPTKPDYIPIGIRDASVVAKTTKHPVFGIGGVNLETINEVLDAGITRVVVVSAILQSSNRRDVIAAIKNKLSGVLS